MLLASTMIAVGESFNLGKNLGLDLNKLFEVIEAHKLFSINYKKIDIVIHPQSLVHAIIKLKNGLRKTLQIFQKVKKYMFNFINYIFF